MFFGTFCARVLKTCSCACYTCFGAGVLKPFSEGVLKNYEDNSLKIGKLKLHDHQIFLLVSFIMCADELGLNFII